MSRSPGFAAALLMLAALASPVVARAQSAGADHDHLHTILEKTFLKVDVLALDVCVDTSTAELLATIARSNRDRAAEDSVARAVLRADHLTATIRFLRNVSYSQFIGGIQDEQRKAVDAGWLPDSTYRSVSASLPDWFSFLENRNIADGETLTYRMDGDTIRSIFTDLNGEDQLDRIDAGYWRRASVLATWLAPGSGFRKGLMDSVWRPRDQGGCAVRSEG